AVASNQCSVKTALRSSLFGWALNNNIAASHWGADRPFIKDLANPRIDHWRVVEARDWLE
ncbi:hypothetical protein, partial [Arthrobacter gyeryongensis]|uniref:hypothetical protein n=1 Tax=Arthrobacter gyeryongensis TaxID=1650592 RepID=UPI0031EC79D5